MFGGRSGESKCEGSKMGRQADMLLAVELKDGWLIEPRGENYVWECSLPPRDSSRNRYWYLAGSRFGAPTLFTPDAGHTDTEVLLGALATFMALEEHECMEWFKRDGKPVVDAHENSGKWDFTLRR